MRGYTRIASTLLLGAIGTAGIPTAHADPALYVTFRGDKAPYTYEENGEFKGFLYLRARQLVTAAGIDANYEAMPPKRIFEDIKANERPACSVGWYKLPERESYAQFTDPIEQDPPEVVIAHPDAAAAIKRHGSITKVFADKNLQFVMNQGVSYNPTLDALIPQMDGNITREVVTPIQLLEQIARKRYDYTIFDQLDLKYLIDTIGTAETKTLVQLTLPDTGEGMKRYFMCSKQVPSKMIESLNTAIRKTAGQTK